MTDVINNKNRGHWIHGGVRVSVRVGRYNNAKWQHVLKQ